MCKQTNLQEVFFKRKKAKILPLFVSLKITTKPSKTTFINTEVLVNEMDIPHTYDLIGIVKDDIAFFHIDELVYIQLTQDITKAGFYVVKTEFGIEIVVKKYGNKIYTSLKRRRGNKNKPLYQEYHIEDFLFIFGKIIY